MKSSDEYLHPENQSQIECQLTLKITEYSIPNDKEQFGDITVKWVR